jgi:hypothetical protein
VNASSEYIDVRRMGEICKSGGKRGGIEIPAYSTVKKVKTK